MDVYEHEIKEIREYYKQKQLYKSINGNHTLEEVVKYLKSNLSQ